MEKPTLEFVFKGGPFPAPLIEIQDADGYSLSVGEWIESRDGYHHLRIDLNDALETLRTGAYRNRTAPQHESPKTSEAKPEAAP